MDRMPVWQSEDRIRVHWLTLLLVVDMMYGVLNLFGKAESASQILLRDVVPIPLWGATLTGSGILIWFGWYLQGAIGATLAWGSLAIASMVSIVNETALSWSGPVLLTGMMGFHMLISYEVSSGIDADRERRQRGG